MLKERPCDLSDLLDPHLLGIVPFKAVLSGFKDILKQGVEFPWDELCQAWLRLNVFIAVVEEVLAGKERRVE